MTQGTEEISSRVKALTTIEILELILENVSDVKSLAACVLTCRTWQEVATPILWRGSHSAEDTPNTVDLEKLAERPERFDYYLRYIRYLKLYQSEKTDVFDRIWNPHIWRNARYRCLTVDLGSEIMSESHMKILLHRDLLALELFGGTYSDQFLDTLKETCPRLRWLLVDDTAGEITSRGLLQTLQSLPALLGLELWYGFEVAINEPVLLHISNMRRLKHLSLGQCDKITSYIIQASDHKLRNLRRLQLRSVEGPALQMLIQQLASLEDFGLMLSESEPTLCLRTHVLSPLSKCHNLLVLTLNVPGPWDIPSDVFIALAKGCPKLRVFELTRLDELQILEASYAQLVSDLAPNLSLLEELEYDQDCRLNESDLSIISKSCPLLRSLSLSRASLKLDIFEDLAEDICFPHLETLTVEKFTMVSGSQVGDSNLVKVQALDSLEESIMKRMPSLIALSQENGVCEELVGNLLTRIHPQIQDRIPRTPCQGRLQVSLLEEALSNSPETPSNLSLDAVALPIN